MGLTCILACLKPIQIIVNIKKIASNLLKKNQELIEVKYFTSRISNDPDKQKRQSIYIEALESVGIKVFYGNYQGIQRNADNVVIFGRLFMKR